ncbi:hypothetical protein CEXT_161741 [Caerostris extrusa]|uniref:Uncharacterized protein n=1 Tax=Caerostris extrusa TaxID=172846 RepID=A0AAV4RR63_CAEEX|nr:hypothetical protein CEXT_161741 [Caerostris extrusa]
MEIPSEVKAKDQKEIKMRGLFTAKKNLLLLIHDLALIQKRFSFRKIQFPSAVNEKKKFSRPRTLLLPKEEF